MAKVQAEGEGHGETGKIKTERAIPKKSPPCFFYFKKKILQSYCDYSSHFAPISLMNSLVIAESPGHAGAVTRLPSTTASEASTATYSPPARVISGPTAGYAVALFAFQHIGSGQNLRTVADCSNGLICCKEFLHDFDDSGGQSQIFGRTTACDKQTCIIGCIYCIKICCQSKVMTSFFGVCLFAFKVVIAVRIISPAFLSGHTTST